MCITFFDVKSLSKGNTAYPPGQKTVSSRHLMILLSQNLFFTPVLISTRSTVLSRPGVLLRPIRLLFLLTMLHQFLLNFSTLWHCLKSVIETISVRRMSLQNSLSERRKKQFYDSSEKVWDTGPEHRILSNKRDFRKDFSLLKSLIYTSDLMSCQAETLCPAG